MLKIGITGNIGSGKTTISKVFEILGVPVFYADVAAKLVMTNDDLLVAGIKEAFGKEAYFSDGSLNRKYIAGKVFNDSAELGKLNTLVHPATFRAFDSWVKEYADAPYVLKEAAILFESGSYKLCDYSLLVTAPYEVRIRRVTTRDNITLEEVKSRDARQMSEEDKLKLADFIIKNDDSELVIPQVLVLHQQFLALANTK